MPLESVGFATLCLLSVYLINHEPFPLSSVVWSLLPAL